MSRRPRLEIGIDCRDPITLAEFWSGALGYGIGNGNGNPYLDLVPVDPADPVVFLQRVPEPKTAKTRIHLDLYVEDPRGEIARLRALGATPVGDPVMRGDGSFNFQLMTDPEGTEFCVCAEH